MKKIALALILTGLLLVCSCTSEKQNIDNTQDASGAQISVQEDEPENNQSQIKKILEGSVVDARTWETVKVSELDYNEDVETAPDRYCEVDLDGDGKNEYLIEFSEYGNTAVIHEYEGEFYAYMIPFRSRTEVKVDGEMMWSSGAEYSGTYRAVFNGKEMEMTKPLDSDFRDDVHFINGESATFDEAMKAWDKFDSKKDADWFFVYELYE